MAVDAIFPRESGSPAGAIHGVASYSPIRRLVIACFVTMSLLGVIGTHLTWLPLEAQAAGHAITNLVGQEHRWSLFSADPRGTSLDMWAEIHRADGSVVVWSIDRNVLGGDLRYYHWVQYMETAVLEGPQESLDGLAEWLATTVEEPVTRIVIYGSQQLGVPPGSKIPYPIVRVLHEADWPTPMIPDEE